MIHVLTHNNKILVGSSNGDTASDLFDTVVADRVLGFLKEDACPDIPDVVLLAKAHLIDARAAVIMGEMASPTASRRSI
jgi:hypothetical protein